MKSSIVYSFLVAALFIAGCRKEDNPKVPELEKVPLPLITQKEGGTTIEDASTFSAVVTVDVYYKFGVQPKTMDLVVIKNGDASNPKVLQAGITTYPTDVTVTGAQLQELFGSTIALGDNFQIGADVITQEDERFPAFPLGGGVPYAPGIANLPGINTQLRFAAPCLFDPALYTEGDYEVVVDEWADFAEGDVVVVTKIDDTHYSFKYLTTNAQPIVMEVNPADNTITVAATVYGDYPQYGITDISAVSVPGASSMVDPCDVSFSVRLDHYDAGGSYGEYTIKLRKL
jgi:hypothetical protein